MLWMSFGLLNVRLLKGVWWMGWGLELAGLSTVILVHVYRLFCWSSFYNCFPLAQLHHLAFRFSPLSSAPLTDAAKQPAEPWSPGAVPSHAAIMKGKVQGLNRLLRLDVSRLSL